MTLVCTRRQEKLRCGEDDAFVLLGLSIRYVVSAGRRVDEWFHELSVRQARCNHIAFIYVQSTVRMITNSSMHIDHRG